MLDPVWIALIADNFLLIAVIVTIFLLFRRIQREHSEKIIEHFIEAYKDNVVVHHGLSQIELGVDQQKNVDKIEKIVEERPYNFLLGFLFQWSQLKDNLLKVSFEKGVKVLNKSLMMEEAYYKRYLVDILGFKRESLKDYDGLGGSLVKEL